MIRVVVADDQPLVRDGFALFVDAEPDLEVVGRAGTGHEAIELARSTRADVVVMDIRMPGLDGIAATRAITADDNLAGVRVLILTTFETDPYIYQALRAGASGFLGKGAEPDDLVRAIRTVHRGDALLSPVATRTVIGRYLEAGLAAPESRDRLAGLTEREREVVTLVGRGLSNEDIARELVVSTHTAKTHVNRAMTKLHAHDRAQIVILAYETGLVRVSAPPRSGDRSSAPPRPAEQTWAPPRIADGP